MFIEADDGFRVGSQVESCAAAQRLPVHGLEGAAVAHAVRRPGRKVECQQPALVVGLERDAVFKPRPGGLIGWAVAFEVACGAPGGAIENAQHRTAPVALRRLGRDTREIGPEGDRFGQAEVAD
jgi:hypothetical protein